MHPFLSRMFSDDCNPPNNSWRCDIESYFNATSCLKDWNHILFHCFLAQTPPAQIIQNQPAEAQRHPAPRCSTSSSCDEASYENVGATQSSQTSSQTEQLESKQSEKVDTVYNIIQGPNVTACKDETRGPSTSQSVALYEEGKPAQVDTVYSVLQRPKSMKPQQQQ